MIPTPASSNDDPSLDPSKPYLFISYAHENAEFAHRLAQDLQQAGINVWIDVAGLIPGMPDWEEAIRAAIEGCRGILLIATPASRVSRYVRAELAFAQADQKTIIPVWADGSEWSDSVTMALIPAQNIDARGNQYANALNRIVSSCRRLLAGQESAQPSPPSADLLAPPPSRTTATDIPESRRGSSRRSIRIGLVLLLIGGGLLAVWIAPMVFNTLSPTPDVTPTIPATQAVILLTETPTSILTPTDVSPTATPTTRSTTAPTITPALTQTLAITPDAAASMGVPTVRDYRCDEALSQTEEGRQFCAAAMITSGFEGTSYDSYQNLDTNVITYGRFAFGLANGDLFGLLNRYLMTASGDIADELTDTYWSRILNRDVALRNDTRLRELLIAAASDPIMQQAQDNMAKEHDWDPVMQLTVEPRCIQSALGKALLFDMAIQQGIYNSLSTDAEAELGLSPVTCISESDIGEHALIEKIAEIRQARLQSIAERDQLPGLAVRGDFWVKLIAQGDWDLQGGFLGQIEISPGRFVAVRPD